MELFTLLKFYSYDNYIANERMFLVSGGGLTSISCAYHQPLNQAICAGGWNEWVDHVQIMWKYDIDNQNFYQLPVRHILSEKNV
jgi:hypothetical protein